MSRSWKAALAICGITPLQTSPGPLSCVGVYTCVLASVCMYIHNACVCIRYKGIQVYTGGCVHKSLCACRYVHMYTLVCMQDCV